MSRMFHLSLLMFMLLQVMISGDPAEAGSAHPVWWDRAAAIALQHGYGLVDIDGMKARYAVAGDGLIVDVRPDYEYRMDHLPNACNLEFDLSEVTTIKPDKKQRFEKLLGADKKREIIIYCRIYN